MLPSDRWHGRNKVAVSDASSPADGDYGKTGKY